MSDIEQVMTDFIRAWEAGELPDPDQYLERVAEGDRDELSEQIRMYMKVAPEPEYDAPTWDALAADSVAAQVAAATLTDPEPWPTLLPRLREHATLTWRQVAERLGVSDTTRAEVFLERMESGDHDPMRVSRKLLDRLGSILGVSAESLAWRGEAATGLYRAAAAAPAAAPRLEALADMAMTPAAQWDDVDDLFLGGRE